MLHFILFEGNPQPIPGRKELILETSKLVTSISLESDVQILIKCMGHIRDRVILENQIMKSYLNAIMSRINHTSSSISDEISNKLQLDILQTVATSGMPSFHPLREMAIALLKKVWVLILRILNGDQADLVELESSNSAISLNKTHCLLGLRITISDMAKLPNFLDIRKNTYRSYFMSLGRKLVAALHQSDSQEAKDWSPDNEVWEALHAVTHATHVGGVVDEVLGRSYSSKLDIKFMTSECGNEESHPTIFFWIGLNLQPFLTDLLHVNGMMEAPECNSNIAVLTSSMLR